MSLRLYMDVHARGPVTTGLRRRGVDVLTAQEDGTSRLDDPRLLDRAMGLGRVLFTQDDDLLNEAAIRLDGGLPASSMRTNRISPCGAPLRIWSLSQKRANRRSWRIGFGSCR